MFSLLRFAQASYLMVTIPLIIGVVIFHWWLKKQPAYRYSLGGVIASLGSGGTHPYKIVFFLIRFAVLIALALLIAKPQLVDNKSKVTVEGIDIILVMDVSGSMQFQDYADDERSRLDSAKEEAIRFVQKRINDPIGIVIFANDAISRCPLTLDKKILENIIAGLHIGVINHEGTLLSTAMMTALNRLKKSEAKSKIMIVLTDGEPSQGDMDPNLVIETAKKLGVKIYTVGIGSDKDELMMHPLFGMIPKPKINKELLTLVATKTGGQFFQVRSTQDMRKMYDTIDTLEKQKIETSLFNNYYDIFLPFVWAIFIVMLIELTLSATWWFSI